MFLENFGRYLTSFYTIMHSYHPIFYTLYYNVFLLSYLLHFYTIMYSYYSIYYTSFYAIMYSYYLIPYTFILSLALLFLHHFTDFYPFTILSLTLLYFHVFLSSSPLHFYTISFISISRLLPTPILPFLYLYS
jgi:hypothetical protein